MGRLKKKEPRPNGLKLLKVAPSPDDGDRYNALSKMADSAGDVKKSLEFSIQETRARRFWHDKPLGGAGATFKFWKGVALEAGSDYGRSLTRPLMIWIVSIFAFASYYLARGNLLLATIDLNTTLPGWASSFPDFAKTFIAQIYGILSNIHQIDCVGGSSGAWQKSLDFSLKTSLFRALPSGELLSGNLRQCLFGAGGDLLGASPIPIDISLVVASQIILSALLFSLFLHAIWTKIRR